jgi:hypothetical protein
MMLSVRKITGYFEKERRSLSHAVGGYKDARISVCLENNVFIELKYC